MAKPKKRGASSPDLKGSIFKKRNKAGRKNSDLDIPQTASEDINQHMAIIDNGSTDVGKKSVERRGATSHADRTEQRRATSRGTVSVGFSQKTRPVLAIAPPPSSPELYHDLAELVVLRSHYSLVAMRVTASVKLRLKIRALLGHLREAWDSGSSAKPSIVLLQARGDGPGASRLVSVVEIAKREYEKEGGQSNDAGDDRGSQGEKGLWYHYSRVDGRLETWNGEDKDEKRRRRLLQLAGEFDDGVKRVNGSTPMKAGNGTNKGNTNAAECDDDGDADEGGGNDEMEEGEVDEHGQNQVTAEDAGEGVMSLSGSIHAGGGGDSKTGREGENGAVHVEHEDEDEGFDDGSDAFESMDDIAPVPPSRKRRQLDSLHHDNSSSKQRVRSVPILSIFISTVRIPELAASLSEQTNAVRRIRKGARTTVEGT